MTPETRLILFYHTKSTSLRRITYFEPSNVKIGPGVWAYRYARIKYEREGKENKNLGWHFYTSLGGMGFHVCYVMILAIFGFDTSRDVYFVRG
jgi:hypothetical protein